MYTYEKVLNVIIQHIQKKFISGNHVVESLRSGTETIFPEPTLHLSETRIEERPIPEILGTPARPMQRSDDEEGEQEEQE